MRVICDNRLENHTTLVKHYPGTVKVEIRAPDGSTFTLLGTPEEARELARQLDPERGRKRGDA